MGAIEMAGMNEWLCYTEVVFKAKLNLSQCT